jgi:glutathione S-transferase
VPTLVLDDGRPLAESNAILWYFGAGTEYLSDDPYERAQTLQWMCLRAVMTIRNLRRRSCSATPRFREIATRCGFCSRTLLGGIAVRVRG